MLEHLGLKIERTKTSLFSLNWIILTFIKKVNAFFAFVLKEVSCDARGATMQKTILSTTEAAVYLGLSPASLAKWRCYSTPGKPSWISFGRAIRYHIEDLDSWIETNRVSANG